LEFGKEEVSRKSVPYFIHFSSHMIEFGRTSTEIYWISKAPRQ